MSQFHCTALERKISVRANRDELVQKGILLPESPLGNIPEPGKWSWRRGEEGKGKKEEEVLKQLYKSG